MAATPVILETDPSAVELMGRMLINLTRSQPGFARQISMIEGDPAAVLVVEYYGESDAELEQKAERLKSHLVASGVRTTADPVVVLDPARQEDVWSVRKAGSGTPDERARRPQADPGHRGRLRPGRAPGRVRRSHRRARGRARHDGRLLRARLGRLPPHPPLDQSQDGRGRSDHVGHGVCRRRSGAPLRRRHVRRARRRPAAVRAERADLRPGALSGDARVQAHLGSARSDEPGQEGRRTADDREPALRAVLSRTGAEDLSRFQCRGGLRARRRDVQRGGRLPQAEGGHHVPLVHGHPRRERLHPRPRQRVARRPRPRHARSPGPGLERRLRRARSLPVMQGVQDRMPVQRRHGQDQDRVSRPLSGRAWRVTALSRLRSHPRSLPAGVAGRAVRQPRDASRSRCAGEESARRGAAAEPLALRGAHLHRSLAQVISGGTGEGRARRVARSSISTTPSPSTTTRASAWRR